MPPSAAPEWLRTGWILERRATSAPASCASMAARIPAQPAPTTRTSCFASTPLDATQAGVGAALQAAEGHRRRLRFGNAGPRPEPGYELDDPEGDELPDDVRESEHESGPSAL